MINKSKLGAIVAVAALSIATPALAQSYTPSDGTGNVLSFSYGPGGAKQRWTVVAPANEQVAAHHSGVNAFALVPRPPRTGGANANNPALTGGGSTGYNEMLLIQ